jgi:hypothetical protein
MYEGNSGSIAGLNGSGVHDQSAIPPPTRANMKANQAMQRTHRANKGK